MLKLTKKPTKPEENVDATVTLITEQSLQENNMFPQILSVQTIIFLLLRIKECLFSEGKKSIIQPSPFPFVSFPITILIPVYTHTPTHTT